MIYLEFFLNVFSSSSDFSPSRRSSRGSLWVWLVIVLKLFNNWFESCQSILKGHLGEMLEVNGENFDRKG